MPAHRRARGCPTYLPAPVEIVATCELKNLSRHKVEELLLRFFDLASRRLPAGNSVNAAGQQVYVEPGLTYHLGFVANFSKTTTTGTMKRMTQDVVQPEVENGMGALPYTVIKITGVNYSNPQAVSSGTGFFYSFREDDWEVHAIVTNKHVVDGLDRLSLHFGLMQEDGKRILGPAEVVSFETATCPIWKHPDPSVDIAVIPALFLLDHVEKNGKKPFFLSLGKENSPPTWLMEKLIATTDIIMVGFPNGLMDVANNLPLVRKGILATPYAADHNGEQNFAVDIAAFGGSSGSPVFAYYNGTAPTEGGWAIGVSAVYLLGILHSGPTVSSIGDVVTVPVPTAQQISHSRLMMHIGYCAKVSLLNDFLPIIKAALGRT